MESQFHPPIIVRMGAARRAVQATARCGPTGLSDSLVLTLPPLAATPALT